MLRRLRSAPAHASGRPAPSFGQPRPASASLGHAAAMAALADDTGLTFDPGAGTADGRSVSLHWPAARRRGQTRPAFATPGQPLPASVNPRPALATLGQTRPRPASAAWQRWRRALPPTARGALPLAHGGSPRPQSRAAAAWAPRCNPCNPCNLVGAPPPPNASSLRLAVHTQALRGGAAGRRAWHAVPGHGLRR